jgi:hypothetical protein
MFKVSGWQYDRDVKSGALLFTWRNQKQREHQLWQVAKWAYEREHVPPTADLRTRDTRAAVAARQAKRQERRGQ